MDDVLTVAAELRRWMRGKPQPVADRAWTIAENLKLYAMAPTLPIGFCGTLAANVAELERVVNDLR